MLVVRWVFYLICIKAFYRFHSIRHCQKEGKVYCLLGIWKLLWLDIGLGGFSLEEYHRIGLKVVRLHGITIIIFFNCYKYFTPNFYLASKAE